MLHTFALNDKPSLTIDIDDVIGLAACRTSWRRGGRPLSARRGLACRGLPGVGVGSLADLHELLLEVLGHRFQQLHVGLSLANLLLESSQLGVDGGLEVRGHLVAELLELLLSLIDEGLGVVLGLDAILALAILSRIGLGILHHAINTGLVKGGRASDSDGLLLA